MYRAYYNEKVADFLNEDENSIFAKIVQSDEFTDQKKRQRDAWLKQIKILKDQLKDFNEAQILFEYSIPRMSKRIDNVVLYKGVVFVIEFKVNSDEYITGAEQVMDYVEDLKEFHKASHNKKQLLVPILLATKAPNNCFEDKLHSERGIYELLCCNKDNLAQAIKFVSDKYTKADFNVDKWINSEYTPTPTIIEAAQYLYRNHTVEGISRHEASAKNLSITTSKVNEIVEKAKKDKKRAICFITGVPGAGKTLVGLNLAIEEQKVQEHEYSIFLSGNGPLVDVLRTALINDQKEHRISDEEKEKDKGFTPIEVKLGREVQAGKRRVHAFIQEIYNFRNYYMQEQKAPAERIAIFDEAQRAWDSAKVAKFLKSREGKEDSDMSEPRFLISVMDRHKDWAVIVCLVGGGQEINEGEAGIAEWFNALQKYYPAWDVYVSDKITDTEYCRGKDIREILSGFEKNKLHIEPDMHLEVSLRQPRNERIAEFIKQLLDIDKDNAKTTLKAIKNHVEDGVSLEYPIRITRDINKAKNWVREQAKEHGGRYGLTVTSTGDRMQKYGVCIRERGGKPDHTSVPNWFLNSRYDVRSSYYLEQTATEYDIQGLEIDWSIVAWGADMRYEDGDFACYKFKNSNYEIPQSGWKKRNKTEPDYDYMKNSYRVLLTRARQGLIIFIPKGDNDDPTSLPEFYNSTFAYLKEIGIEEI